MKGTTIEQKMIRDPFTVDAATPVKAAQKMMIERKFRHLPVVDGERVVGVVSDRDILLAQLAHLGLDADSLTIEDVCTLEPYAVAPDALLAAVVHEMANRHIGSALVIDNGRLVGIYTATDACRHLGEFLSA